MKTLVGIEKIGRDLAAARLVDRLQFKDNSMELVHVLEVPGPSVGPFPWPFADPSVGLVDDLHKNAERLLFGAQRELERSGSPPAFTLASDPRKVS